MAGIRKVAIVTGGGSGIGEAICKRLASDGAAVAVWDLNAEGAERVAQEINDKGGRAAGFTVDVTDRDAIDAALAAVEAGLGSPNILVNNAGMSGHGNFLEYTEERFHQITDVNYFSVVRVSQAVIPKLLEQGWGRVINISSSSAQVGVPRIAAYAAAKAAVISLTKCLAVEFAGSGVTVNTIPPGFINTPMMRTSAAGGAISIEEQIGRTPAGRAGEPEDVAALTAFLASDDGEYITGQVYGVNGGRII